MKTQISHDQICNDQTEKIAKSFGEAAITYNTHAKLQYDCAQHLLEIIKKHQTALPKGTILEIGCGTGFITQRLIKTFPQRDLEITDLSTEMLSFCQSHINIPEKQECQISFYCLNGENSQKPQRIYAAIVGGFVIQWFRDPVNSLSRLIQQLLPKGILVISFPTCDSFPEWQNICHQLDLPFTANPLPDPAQLLQLLPDEAHLLHAETLEQVTTHANAADFFRSLKTIGAGVSQTNQRLSAQQIKRLMQAWDAQSSDKINVRHQIAFLAIQRKF